MCRCKHVGYRARGMTGGVGEGGMIISSLGTHVPLRPPGIKAKLTEYKNWWGVNKSKVISLKLSAGSA